LDVGTETKGYPKPRIMEPRTETDLSWKKFKNQNQNWTKANPLKNVKNWKQGPP